MSSEHLCNSGVENFKSFLWKSLGMSLIENPSWTLPALPALCFIEA
jgi:hypothetical protein